MATRVLVIPQTDSEHNLLGLMFMFFLLFVPILATNLALELMVDNSASSGAINVATQAYWVSIIILIGVGAYWFITIFGRGLTFWLRSQD